MVKFSAAMLVLWTLVSLGFSAFVVYVIVHFVTKSW